jgi:hypothetical protein
MENPESWSKHCQNCIPACTVAQIILPPPPTCTQPEARGLIPASQQASRHAHQHRRQETDTRTEAKLISPPTSIEIAGRSWATTGESTRARQINLSQNQDQTSWRNTNPARRSELLSRSISSLQRKLCRLVHEGWVQRFWWTLCLRHTLSYCRVGVWTWQGAGWQPLESLSLFHSSSSPIHLSRPSDCLIGCWPVQQLSCVAGVARDPRC